MDSKYGAINAKNNINGFKLKRKLVNGDDVNKHNLKNHVPKKIKFNGNVDETLESNISKSNESQNGESNTIKSLSEQRKSLPAYNVKFKLLELLKQNPTLILLGETGSGKTTQIPQIVLEGGIAGKGVIAVTQPRRVAAITVAQRVAQEKNCVLGELVGYSVRFEDMTSYKTRIKYMTDGLLLREALIDRLLIKYSVIVLDEAHERTINTDVLFGIVKEAQKIRKSRNMNPLKVIIMSATMDVDHFKDYFTDSLPVYLTGRSYPVRINHVKVVQDDYIHSCLVTLFQIHKTAPPQHDILIFLTGQEEIDAMCTCIRHVAKDVQCKGPTIRVFPFYSALPHFRQLDVFRPTPSDSRKVVVSTNIAETSLTISGIKYVIDSGKAKIRTHDSTTGMEKLKVMPISQAQTWQRAGRAGRESEGTCYRTYTVKEFEEMSKNPVPEILRANTTTTLLQLLAMNINIEEFEFLDKPPPESVQFGLEQLRLLGAIESVKTPKLTDLGKKMSNFPLDAKYSKLLLAAPEYGCLEDMLNLVAVMSGENVYLLPAENREVHLARHKKFDSVLGDHISLLNIFRAFQKNGEKKKWCHENSLNSRNLIYAAEVRSQLAEICNKCDLSMSSCGNNFDQIRKCLIAGLFMNTAELQRDNKYLTLSGRQRAFIHPSSILRANRPECVLYTEIVQTGRSYMRHVTSIEPHWISEVAPHWKETKWLRRDK